VLIIASLPLPLARTSTPCRTRRPCAARAPVVCKSGCVRCCLNQLQSTIAMRPKLSRPAPVRRRTTPAECWGRLGGGGWLWTRRRRGGRLPKSVRRDFSPCASPPWTRQRPTSAAAAVSTARYGEPRQTSSCHGRSQRCAALGRKASEGSSTTAASTRLADSAESSAFSTAAVYRTRRPAPATGPEADERDHQRLRLHPFLRHRQLHARHQRD
jgi:hypothetical protein